MLMAEFIKTVPRVEFEPKDKSEKYFTGYYRFNPIDKYEEQRISVLGLRP